MSPHLSGTGTHAAGGFRVVAIGGGTGLSTLLKGLKHFTVAAGERPSQKSYIAELTAVVTVSDDGGSSGRLRRELNMLPPGDIRNCLVAVSEDENLLSKLFQHRFAGGGDLEGHSFGNLFLAALTAVSGDFAVAVRQASEILVTRGRIFPATSANVQLEALMDDGSRVQGETSITASERRIVELSMIPSSPEPLPETLEAIAEADLITIGPGSLFTSLVPNLLVRGIPEAIAASHAVKVFICNLMTEANESLNMTASDHLRALLAHSRNGIVDYALVNSAPVSPAMKRQYAGEQAQQVQCDVPAIEAMHVKCITGNFIDEHEVVRHATDRVCSELMRLAEDATQRFQLAKGLI